VAEERRRAWRNGNGPAARPLRVVAGAALTHRRVLLRAHAAPQLAEHRPRSAGLPRGPAGPRVASRMKAPLCCGPPRSGVGRCGAQPAAIPAGAQHQSGSGGTGQEGRVAHSSPSWMPVAPASPGIGGHRGLRDTGRAAAAPPMPPIIPMPLPLSRRGAAVGPPQDVAPTTIVGSWEQPHPRHRRRELTGPFAKPSVLPTMHPGGMSAWTVDTCSAQ
jgi:hypothetical protein